MNTNFTISIPEPCHEDWNKMTPDEKGAFCKVCCKSVYDFTKKTAEEIGNIISEQISKGKKVCGRFERNQLSPAPVEIPDLNIKKFGLSRLTRFALAIALVFGGWLLNTTQASAQKTMGKVSYTCRLPVNHDFYTCELPLVKGEVKYVPAKKDTLKAKSDTLAVDTKNTTCSLKVKEKNLLPIPKTVVESVSLVEQDVNDVTIPPILCALMTDPYPDYEIKNETPQIIDGEFAIDDTTGMEVIPLNKISPVAEEKTSFISPELTVAVKCYPNPSKGMLYIKYELADSSPIGNENVSISLYDLNGNKLQSFSPATSETQVDMSSFADGIYFCEMKTGETVLTKKIILSR
ncbi:MAG TPA: T9SS type A sorting domain-containing protein [Bacteroidia bacterium]